MRHSLMLVTLLAMGCALSAPAQDSPEDKLLLFRSAQQNPKVLQMRRELDKLVTPQMQQICQAVQDTLAMRKFIFTAPRKFHEEISALFERQTKKGTTSFEYSRKRDGGKLISIAVPFGPRATARLRAIPVGEHDWFRGLYFESPDGFKATFVYVVDESAKDDENIAGMLAEVYGYMPDEVDLRLPRITQYDKRITMDSVRTAARIGAEVEKQLAGRHGSQALVHIDTTYIDGQYPVCASYMQQLLHDIDEADNIAEALSLMKDFSQKASENELTAIGFALRRTAEQYPKLLTREQYLVLWDMLQDLEARAKQLKSPALDYIRTADAILHSKVNRSVNLAAHDQKRHDLLKQTGFTVTKNEGGRWYYAVWGRHYSGDAERPYFDGCADEDGVLRYHAEHREQDLRPGVYRLRAAVRTSGQGPSGAYIFVETTGREGESQRVLVEIEGCGEQYGNIWQWAAMRVSDAMEHGEKPSPHDVRIALANGGLGFGWNRVSVEGIEVRDGTICYGVSCDPDFTGHPFRHGWLSASDFQLERMGDLPEEEEKEK